MRVLVVDDEAPARARLSGLVAELDGYEVVGEAANGEDALATAQAEGPDVVLMDIRMPGMDGIEAARHLGALDEPPAVIFITAYDEYAIEAFSAQAIGYLMKPVRRRKLEATLLSAARLTRPQLTALAAADPGAGPRTQIAARVGEIVQLIPVADVLFFQADSKYVRVRHRGGDVLIDDALKALEDEFSSAFVRIHRSALVAVAHLKAIHRDGDGGCEVELRGCDERLAVSRRHVATLKQRFGARER